jgi:hypothetical protein
MVLSLSDQNFYHYVGFRNVIFLESYEGIPITTSHVAIKSTHKYSVTNCGCPVIPKIGQNACKTAIYTV